MIRIKRGKEPADLAAKRASELERVNTAIQAGTELSGGLIGEGYRDLARKPLWQAQHHKCCFCELKTETKHHTVEHYRPKTEVQQYQGQPPRRGYWWLAWTWENLLFCCTNCNTKKGIQFPLEQGSQSLDDATQQAPPGNERPLLLDPAVDDPMEHIVFSLNGTNWVPTARNGSTRGDATIGVAGLDRDDLLDLYRDHCQHLEEALRQFDEHLYRGLHPSVVWRTISIWAEPTSAFAALSYDVIDAHIPADVRRQYGLHLPRP